MIKLKIEKKIVSEKSPIFYIAEAGVNHNGSIEIAKKMIDVAKKAGADAIKFQSFNTKEIIIPKGPKAKYHNETVGIKKSWFELLKSQEMSFKMHKALINHCKKKKIIFLSTPYDYASAAMLNRLKVGAFKIASTDNDNFPLIEKIIKFNKPILISTAMTNFKEIKEIILFLKKKKFKKYLIFQCTGNYPSLTSDSNLKVIQSYKNNFNCLVGHSDHTLNNISSLAAVGMGVKIIEKHFTLNKKMYGPDHRMSLSPIELTKSIDEIRQAEKALGSKEKKVLQSEIDNRKKLKKSIVASQDIKKNQIIHLTDLKVKRPGYGIRPIYLKKIIGLKARKNISEDTVLNYEMLKK